IFSCMYATNPEGASMRILVADDDLRVRQAIGTLLQSRGFEVVLVGDGREALHAIDTEAFDIVILGIFMPGIDGLATIRTLHKRPPDMPVIATSGLTFPETMTNPPDYLAMAAKLGAAGGLRTPCKSAELLAMIQTCLRRSGS